MFNKHKVTSQGKKVYEQTVCFQVLIMMFQLEKRMMHLGFINT